MRSLGTVALTVCCAAVAGAAVAIDNRLVLVAIALLLVAFLFYAPMRLFPAFIVWSFALLPVGYMNVGLTFSRYFTPAVIVLAVFVFRTLVQEKVRDPSSRSMSLWFTVLPAIAGIGLVASIIGSVDPRMSLAWSLAFAICVVGAHVVASRGGMAYWPRFVLHFLILGIFLGVVSALDYIFGINPWNDILRVSVTEKSWSVFRSRTSLGHPLLTSLVASTVLMVGIFEIVKSKGSRRLAILGACGAAVAIAASVSRTGVVSIVAGLLIGLLAISVQFGFIGFGKVIAIGGAGIFGTLALLNSPLFVERNSSSGGVASSEYRDTVFANAVSMIRDQNLLGSGPGTSSRVFSDQFGLVFENSWLQIVVSCGILVGTAAFFILVALIAKGVRCAPPGVVAAFTSFLVSVAGFSAVDNNPACLVIVFPVLMCLLGSITQTSNRVDLRSNPSSGTRVQVS